MIRPRRAQVVVEWIPNRHDSSVHFEDAISPKLIAFLTRSLDYAQSTPRLSVNDDALVRADGLCEELIGKYTGSIRVDAHAFAILVSCWIRLKLNNKASAMNRGRPITLAR